MLSYNSLTYVQDMKIGHYSRFPSNTDGVTHILQVQPEAVETGNRPRRELSHSTLPTQRLFLGDSVTNSGF